MREVGTQEDRPSAPLVERVQAGRENRQANPPVHILRSDGERNTSSEAVDSTLSRKATIENEGARTANRHRWVRRES